MTLFKSKPVDHQYELGHGTFAQVDPAGGATIYNEDNIVVLSGPQTEALKYSLGFYDTAPGRIEALEKERDDYILKQKVWEQANDELRSAHIELLRQRDALTPDAERYRFLRNRTWVEAYWIDGSGGIDTKIRAKGCVDHLDKAVDMERIKEPRSQSDREVNG